MFNGLCRNRQWIGPTALLAWLLKAWHQRWPSFPPLKVIFRPWATEEQSAQVVRQLGMLQWIYHEPAFEKAPCPAPEDMPLTKDMRQRLLALATFPQVKLPLASLPDNDTTVLRVLMEMEKRAVWGHLASEHGVAEESAKVLLDPNVREATRSRRPRPPCWSRSAPPPYPPPSRPGVGASGFICPWALPRTPDFQGSGSWPLGGM